MRWPTHRLLGVGLSVALALAGAVLGSSARPVSAAPSPTGSAARAEHQRIVDFWTPERVAKAVPRDFVRDPETGRFTLQPNRAPSTKKPAASTVLGATWTDDALVEKTTGKVYFQMGAGYWVCSASVVDDTSTQTSVILTAGHCVYDNATGVFATNWMFVPDYASAPVALTADKSFCADTAYGCWTAQALTVAQGFASQTTFNTTATLNDFAFATVGDGGHSPFSQLDATVGSQAIQYTDGTQGKTVDLFGYPAAGKYTGANLVYSEGPLGLDPYNGKQTYRVASSLTGGSSGGPWFAGFDKTTGRGTMMSVNSYGYSRQAYMHGPRLNDTTRQLFAAAKDSSGNRIVVPVPSP